MLHEGQPDGETGTQEEPVSSARLSIEERSINTIRMLSVDAVERAQSGHPGLPLGAAPMAYILWQHHLRHSPSNPKWANRDRFVLSAGHGSMLLYSLLHLTGYPLTLDDIKAFRQWGSKTPGHPEFHLTPGVEATTGPLGQGAANAVGMAIAERALAYRFNRPGHTIVDHYTFALCSDGDMMEGVVAEAASLAGHLKLGKLVYLFDSNDVSLDGPTSITFTENVGKRFEAYGWHVQLVEDGNRDLAAIDAAIVAAKAETHQPSLIIVRTTIGYGAPTKGGKYQAHGSPLGAEEVKGVRSFFHWEEQAAFAVPEAVRTHLCAVERGRQAEKTWQGRFDAYAKAYPDLAGEWDRTLRGDLPSGWQEGLPAFEIGSEIETRSASGKVLNAIAARVPALIGGDADLSSSTKTAIAGGDNFDGQSGAGRNIRFGVREHAMTAITNGMAYHGGLRPYASTFFIFSDYMRPSIRLAAMNGLATIFLWTHDSIAVGEDGPTHEPIEQLASLRAMPNMTLIRPADANETVAAWVVAMQHTSGPIGLVLSRQRLPVLQETAQHAAAGVQRGAYVLVDAEGGRPAVILIASGSEVQIALAARELLLADAITARVVSMPSWELFESQEPSYRESVLPSSVARRVSIEAGATFGWQRYVGPAGVVCGIDRFGASAPYEVNLEKFGFTAAAVAAIARKLVGAGRAAAVAT
jgi:transketolase